MSNLDSWNKLSFLDGLLSSNLGAVEDLDFEITTIRVVDRIAFKIEHSGGVITGLIEEGYTTITGYSSEGGMNEIVDKYIIPYTTKLILILPEFFKKTLSELEEHSQ